MPVSIFRFAVLVIVLVAAAPGAFWLFYGTLEPCEAVALRGPQIYAQREAGSDTEAALVESFGALAFRQILVEAAVTPDQCLDMLWRLETDQDPHL